MKCTARASNGISWLWIPALASLGRNDGTEFYASPLVSNIAASSASRAGLPAQTTNWNAWK